MQKTDSKKQICKKQKCVSRESNPGQLLGRQLCCHYTTDADEQSFKKPE